MSESETRVGGDATEPIHVLIAGGGIAGLELLAALNQLAPDGVRITLAAPDREFTYRPFLVREPFTKTPPQQIALTDAAQELGADYVHAGLVSVDPEAHQATLSDGSTVDYDVLVVCAGAALEEAFEQATTLYGFSDHLAIEPIIEQAAKHPSRRLAFVVPPGMTWPLPLYEVAMMAERRAGELDLEIEILIVTPEHGPLSVFGRIASQEIAKVLDRRGIAHEHDTYVRQADDGSLVRSGTGEALEAGAVIALPTLHGRELDGLPADAEGFIPIDCHGCVHGTEDVFAAGDGANFPLKQGGIAALQADAVAQMIAARAGAAVEPKPFSPLLRAKLLTGDEPLYLAVDLGGGAGEGRASHDYLWWPPQKVAGRYLSAWLSGTSPQEDMEPPDFPLDVEVSRPMEWHRTPSS